MTRYFLVLRDDSPNSNPIYLRFDIDKTATVYLLEKVFTEDWDNIQSLDHVDTHYSGCPRMLTLGDEPVNWTTDAARAIWRERIGEGRWERISEAEVVEDCVPDYVMHQILDGVEIQ